MPIVSAFVVGALFAVGLGISGMTQPEKIFGFLDFFGSWDATLLFVMISAIPVYFIFDRAIRGSAPILTTRFHLPTRRDIDTRLLAGAALFGIGWGLGGFCPGPALTSLGSGARGALLFVAGMVAGMYVVRTAEKLLGRKQTQKLPAAP